MSLDDKLKRGYERNTSKIFFFGVCVDNNDPLRAGRVRAVVTNGTDRRYGRVNDPLGFVTEWDSKHMVGVDEYKPWGKKDPFLCAPFLPLHINVIPKVKEAVKMVYYDPLDNTQNQEYIGPLISQPHQINLDVYNNGRMHTSLGNSVIPSVGVVYNDGSKGTSPNPDDIALVGRDNCDIILGMREKKPMDSLDGVSGGSDVGDEIAYSSYPQILIRSGKLIENEKIPSFPKSNLQQTFIQLNTFPTSLEGKEETITTEVEEDTNLVTLIEWYIDPASINYANPNLDPTQIANNTINGSVVLYKMPLRESNMGRPYKAGKFQNNTVVSAGKTEVARLQFFTVSGGTERVSTIISDFIRQVDTASWSDLVKPIGGGFTSTKSFNPDINPSNPENIGQYLQLTHPLYYRPDSITFNITQGIMPVGVNPAFFPQQSINAKLIASKVKLDGVPNEGFGLAFTNEAGQRTVITNEVSTTDWVMTSSSQQQGMITAAAEKIYLLSYNTSVVKGPIKLKTNYGFSQEELVTTVMDRTNSIVRGEKLLELLEKVVHFMTTHVHEMPNYAPFKMTKDGMLMEEVTNAMNNAKEEVLNKNIRIN